MSANPAAWHPFEEGIRLHVEGRIDPADAARQTATAREILRRFADRPGLVLADEVGMGKTFVALAVAASVALSDRRRRPVVVMVPPALKEKWPVDFKVFAEQCLDEPLRRRLRAESAANTLDLLKLLDNTPDRRPSLIFLTHGAMHRGLTDGWVKLAAIQRALKGRRDTGKLRRPLCRRLGGLLQMKWAQRKGGEELWDRLLRTNPQQWREILIDYGILEKGADDPVPTSILSALEALDRSSRQTLYEALLSIPQRDGPTHDQRLQEARRSLNSVAQDVWKICLGQLGLRFPLLILDEAHHLKNAKTRLAGLFQSEDSRGDADEIARGTLAGVFERMLFLTATPFQLGHEELCSVLDRFDGIAWKSKATPPAGREEFRRQREDLRRLLNAAQFSTQNLDAAWGRLRMEDMRIDGRIFSDSSEWWDAIGSDTEGLTLAAAQVRHCFRDAKIRMKDAEAALRPWVLRHLRERLHQGVPRRLRLPGRAIESDIPEPHEPGLGIEGPALLPFLLAARAAQCAPDSRPLFAEGLASSYEAFLDTRKRHSSPTDGEDELDAPSSDQTGAPDDASRWYLARLERALPPDRLHRSAAHPKIAATAARVLELWREGEKVVVFCHYRATGRILRQVISGLIRDEIHVIGARRTGRPLGQIGPTLERIGQRFFDRNSPARRACDEQAADLLAQHPNLDTHRDELLELCRRYLRTPSFLARYVPLAGGRLDADGVRAAFAQGDGSGLSLGELFAGFFEFLEVHRDERRVYVDAVGKMQTGTLHAREAFAADEAQGDPPAELLPNVRLVNGATGSETRQLLMRGFNSPFFPEILVASSVMAEGVDLHRFCRHVIHHDLSWNPSSLEQRTGRLDRIGAKIERCGRPIHVYLPYLAETQDEKMYRVVMDRERWFSVVMGEHYKVDVRTTDRLAERVPVPERLASSLAFRLETAP